MQKIALLFLTRGELNHPLFWQILLAPCLDRFNLYIHSKDPIKDPFFKPFRIFNSVPTTYLIHAKAWQALLEEAMHDLDNKKFIFLSESCIPLYPLEYIYQCLVKDDRSHMMYGAPWWGRDEPREVTELSKEHRWGNAEWLILNRKHAQMIVEDKEIIAMAASHPHDQESYPSVLFSLKGCLDEFVYRQTTYAITNPEDFPHAYHFHDYDPLCAKIVYEAKMAKSLFVRKFTLVFPQSQLFDILHTRLNSLISIEKLQILMQLELERAIKIRSRLEALIALEEMSISNSATILSILINQLGLKVGYELGACCGLHAERLIKQASFEKIYAVDSYTNHKQLRMQSLEWDALYLQADQLLSAFKPNIELKRQSPLEAAREVDDQSIDFVFINDNHCRESTGELIRAWYPKVRAKGVICGYQLMENQGIIAEEVLNFFNAKQIKVGHANRVETGFWWAVL